jgi:uncharacterized membrane protein YhaH (DUF805 family)
MFGILFGQVKTGRLLRLPYLGYSILLALIFIALGIGIGVAIGAAEHMVGGNLQQAQAMLMQQYGKPAILLVAVLGLALMFANLNLMAKRIRDTGLPGWWTVLIIVIASGILGGVTSGGAQPVSSTQAAGGIHALVWLALLLIPSNLFSAKTS